MKHLGQNDDDDSDVETVQVRILQTRFKEWLREAPFFGGSG